MEKGKLGIKLTTYAVIAFVLAIFGQMLLCGLLLGFVLLVEKDEWTSRQCMQAFFLTFLNGIVGGISTVGSLGNSLFGGFTYYSDFYYGGAWNTVFGVLAGIVAIVVFVFEIIGLVHVVKGQEANIPVFSGWAMKAFGRVQQKAAPPPQQYYNQGYPQQGQPVPPPPAGQGAWQQPQQAAWPAQQPVAPPPPAWPSQPQAAPQEPAYTAPEQAPVFTNEPPAAPPPPPPVYTNEPPVDTADYSNREEP